MLQHYFQIAIRHLLKYKNAKSYQYRRISSVSALLQYMHVLQSFLSKY